jgi:predicted DNA-binding protein (UPF0251 family)
VPRPHRNRQVETLPPVGCFKPAGRPRAELPERVLTVDEFEALRLADHEGLYQEAAAARMGVSRPTFGRIVQSARRKVAGMLVEGSALRIEGGPVRLGPARTFACAGCGHAWSVPHGTGRPADCPDCGSGAVRRVDAGAGQGGGTSRGRGRGRGRGGGRHGGPGGPGGPGGRRGGGSGRGD